MLQQTRAAAVAPFYEKFLKRFPDLATLARSCEADLLGCWSGLGYYSRARNLRRAAQHIVRTMAGKLPEAYEQWVALPGIGPYTAAAMASIGFGAPVAVLDGNVARVMARLTNHHGDVRSPKVREELRRRAQALLDHRHPGEFNQALMELGATVCLPRNPQCLLCPVAEFCQARRRGLQNELPIKLRRQNSVRLQITVGLVRRTGRVLLQQRPRKASLLAGFWELPQAEGPELEPDCLAPFRLSLGEPIGRFRHSITRHEYTVSVFRASLQGRRPAGFKWVTSKKLKELPLTTVTRKALRLAEPRA